MKIYKEIEVPLDKYRENLINPAFKYTKGEIKKLSCLYDMFEGGSWDAAIELTRKWSNEEQELIPCEIYDILFDISMGAQYKF